MMLVWLDIETTGRLAPLGRRLELELANVIDSRRIAIGAPPG